MNVQSVTEQIRNQSPQKALRTIMYAQLADPSLARGGTLHHEAMEILKLDEDTYRRLLREQYVWWNEKQAKISNQILQSALLQNYLRSSASLFSSSTITRDNACYLIADMLSMALQKESLLALKNCMKTKKTAELLAWLDDPQVLGPYKKDVFCPIRQVIRKKYSLASDDFILRTLLVSEILGDFLYQYHQDPAAARTWIGPDTLHRLVHSDTETISEFLNGLSSSEEKREEKEEEAIRIRT